MDPARTETYKSVHAEARYNILHKMKVDVLFTNNSESPFTSQMLTNLITSLYHIQWIDQFC